MAIKTLSYLDVPPERRAKAGTVALVELQRALNFPGLSIDQRNHIQARIAKVQAWMEGSAQPTQVKLPGAHHVVTVSDSVKVDDAV